MINLLQRLQGLSRSSKVLFSLVIILIVAILHVIKTPSIEIDTLLSIDKVAHIMIFYFVGLWFFLITKKDHSLILMILLFILAVTMEFLQMNLSYRSFDWFDWLADAFGILLSFFHLSKKL